MKTLSKGTKEYIRLEELKCTNKEYLTLDELMMAPQGKVTYLVMIQITVYVLIW